MRGRGRKLQSKRSKKLIGPTTIPPSLSVISTIPRSLDMMTPGKSDNNLTSKFSTPSSIVSSMIVMFVHDASPIDCPEAKLIVLGSPV